MKVSNRSIYFVLAVAVLAVGAAIFSTGSRAQEEGWQILRADYGFRNQRTDVTDILKDLVGRGGVNGRVVVNNQTMGGDPAVGKDKSLRIFARNRRNEEREFNYNEGGFVEVRMFTVRRDDRDDHPANYGNRDRDDHPANYADHDRDARPANYGDHDRDDWNSLKIIGGYFGVAGRNPEVAGVPSGRNRDRRAGFCVPQYALRGDPTLIAQHTLY